MLVAHFCSLGTFPQAEGKYGRPRFTDGAAEERVPVSRGPQPQSCRYNQCEAHLSFLKMVIYVLSFFPVRENCEGHKMYSLLRFPQVDTCMELHPGRAPGPFPRPVGRLPLFPPA